MLEVIELGPTATDQASDTGEFPDNYLTQESVQHLRELLVFGRILGLERSDDPLAAPLFSLRTSFHFS